MEVTLWLTVNIRSGCTLTTDKTVGSPRARALVLPCGSHVLGLLRMWGIARDWVSSRFSPFNWPLCACPSMQRPSPERAQCTVRPQQVPKLRCELCSIGTRATEKVARRTDLVLAQAFQTPLIAGAFVSEVLEPNLGIDCCPCAMCNAPGAGDLWGTLFVTKWVLAQARLAF